MSNQALLLPGFLFRSSSVMAEWPGEQRDQSEQSTEMPSDVAQGALIASGECPIGNWTGPAGQMSNHDSDRLRALSAGGCR